MVIRVRELERMIGGRPSPIPPFCLGCGYDLTGAVSAECPECGQVFVAKEWRQKVAEIELQGRRIKEINEWVSHAFKLAVASCALSLVSLLLGGSCAGQVLRVVALVGGLPAVLLGLGVFRAKRLPAWVRDQPIPSPSYARAVASILLGAAAAGIVIAAPW